MSTHPCGLCVWLHLDCAVGRIRRGALPFDLIYNFLSGLSEGCPWVSPEL